jgi:hypothetical protein
MSMSGWWPAASAAEGDLVDEHHRLGEVGAHEGLDDLASPSLPAGQVLQALGDRGVVQPWHGSSFPGKAIVCYRRHR